MNLPATFDLTGKTALVTGASRGLGKHFAIELARAGVDVAITARSLESLEPTVTAIRALGRRAVPLVLDVRDHAAITAAVDAAHAALGRLDILINNAGCNIRKPAADISWDDWNTVLDTNLRGPFFVAQAAARYMVPAGRGRIINLGSVTYMCRRLRRPRALRRQSRRDQTTHDESRRRLGPCGRHRQLPRTRLV